ncbi:MAG: outer membrane protein assembly factor BamB [Burkholderiaceae bacterium]|nr:outer membrane protein assembly factor BamB [Burkholderiaceae bacterium]
MTARTLAPAARRAVIAALALGLGGCAWWPWSSSRPKLPDPPPITAPASASLGWSVSLGAGGVNFQPVLAGDSLWAAARDGTVARIDPATGAARWRVKLEEPLIAGAGSDGGTVVVAGREGSLIALDGGGNRRWSVPTGAEVVTVPSVALGLVIVRTSDNRVSAFELDTGKRRWTFQRQSPPLVLRQTSGIAIDASSAYVGLPGGRLVALTLDSGALRWEAAVSTPRGSNEIERIADVVGMPLVGGREVCAASFQGRLACFDAVSGRTLWSRELSSPSGFDMDSDLVVSPDESGDVHAFSRRGASVWRQDGLKRRELSAPLLLPRFVVIGDHTGLVHVLQREDGRVAARLTTDGAPIVSAPVAAAGLAVVQTSGSGLYAFRIE